jgi:hypothetical protein
VKKRTSIQYSSSSSKVGFSFLVRLLPQQEYSLSQGAHCIKVCFCVM